MKILVVGHGYVGKALAEQLAAQGNEVVAANRSEDAGAEYPVLAADVSDQSSVSALADQCGPVDAIVHCASSSGGGTETYRSVFLDGLTHLQVAFPGVPIFFTSSSSVYGQTDGSVVEESSATEPDRETSRILVEAETLACENGGTVLRLAGIYGPSRSIYLKRILSGDATIEAGEPSRFVNQVHRDDIVGAITHLLGLESEAVRGRCFNVADDVSPTQRELYTRLAETFDLPVPSEAPPNKNRKRAWTNKIVSNAALRATGWVPLYPSFFDAVSKDPDLVPSVRAQVESDG